MKNKEIIDTLSTIFWHVDCTYNKIKSADKIILYKDNINYE